MQTKIEINKDIQGQENSDLWEGYFEIIVDDYTLAEIRLRCYEKKDLTKVAERIIGVVVSHHYEDSL